MNPPLIQLTGAGVYFGALGALVDVNVSVGRAERVALIGGNGSGKSTLLRLMHGLLEPSVGQRRCAPEARQAMLFQRPYLMRSSVQNNLAMGLWLKGVPWQKAKVQGLSALARVGLADLALRNAKTLSGGQQQRVALARAWALKPDVLLLDEPTASLDPHAKREVEVLMHEFACGQRQHAAEADHPDASGESPMTLIFASHNLGQVKRLASRVIYLEQGRVLADLPTELFFNPAHLVSVCPAADLFLKGEL